MSPLSTWTCSATCDASMDPLSSSLRGPAFAVSTVGSSSSTSSPLRYFHHTTANINTTTVGTVHETTETCSDPPHVQALQRAANPPRPLADGRHSIRPSSSLLERHFRFVQGAAFSNHSRSDYGSRVIVLQRHPTPRSPIKNSTKPRQDKNKNSYPTILMTNRMVL